MMNTPPMERDNAASIPAGPVETSGHAAGLPHAGKPASDASAEPSAQLPSSVVDELFSILSHELRAPLTTIKGSSRTLLRHGAALDPATSRQLLQDIDQEADRLHRLVDNLLELARAGTGKGALRTEPTAVDALLRRVVADATPRAGDRRLRVRASANLPHPRIDPVRIEQVVRNLIDNAVKFSPPTGTIDLSAAHQEDAIVVAVRDDGPGVPPEYHHRVFERFFRVEREGSTVAGAGLGLAICKRFVELHGGWIELDSRPGNGATFRFALPLRTSSSVGESTP
jgi:two-component system sensor histidine kinase KdpD